MTHTVHSSSSLWLVKLAASFDFCDRDEKQMVYRVLISAWKWGRDS
jgi:hypothetical protein